MKTGKMPNVYKAFWDKSKDEYVPDYLEIIKEYAPKYDSFTVGDIIEIASLSQQDKNRFRELIPNLYNSLLAKEIACKYGNSPKLLVMLPPKKEAFIISNSFNGNTNSIINQASLIQSSQIKINTKSTPILNSNSLVLWVLHPD